MPVALPGSPDPDEIVLLDDRAYQWQTDVWRRHLPSDFIPPPVVNQIWTGADPVFVGGSTAASYELGVIIAFAQNVHVVGLWAFQSPSSSSVTGRTGKLWSYDSHTVLATADMDVAPWTGWKYFPFNGGVSIARTAATTADTTNWVMASHSATGYCRTSPAFSDASVVSADGAAMMVWKDYLFAGSPENGRFSSTPGTWPDTGLGGISPWYGIDIGYTVDDD